MRRLARAFTLASPLILAACATFSSARSAAPPPGIGLHTQGTVTSPPGEEAGWFWTAACEAPCNVPLVGLDLLVTYGLRGADSSAAPLTLGAGVSGIVPMVEAYWRLGWSPTRPYGVGARVSRFQRWTTYNVFGRLDGVTSADYRLLWNPGIVVHTGTSPNGQNDGTFVGLVQSVGAELGAGPVRTRPSVAVVVGRAGHVSYGTRHGPATNAFVTLSVGIGYEAGRR